MTVHAFHLAVLACSLCAGASAFRMPLHRHNNSRPARAPRALGVQHSILPMKGSFHWIGEYYGQFTIGGQPANLLIDTGSSDLGVSSSICRGATPLGCDWCKAHANKETSSKCQNVPGDSEKQCTFEVRYEDGQAFTSALYEDTVQFGRSPAATPATNNTVVGAYIKQSINDVRDVDGIIGLAGVGCSSSGASTAFDDLVQQHGVADVFATCLPNTGNGGQLYIGQDNGSAAESDNSTIADVPLSPHVDSDIVWTKRKAGSPFWAVEMEDLRIAGKSIGVRPSVYNTGDAVVDSGSSVVFLADAAWKAFRKTINEVCYKKLTCVTGLCNCKKLKPLSYSDSVLSGSCFLLNPLQIARYPMIEVVFSDGGVVKMPPQRYMRSGTQFCSGKGPSSIAFTNNKPDKGTILGDAFMMGQLVVHDRANQRIGFKSLTNDACP